jgi:hypothetical protein
MKIRSIYWKLADVLTFPLALIAALGAIENSYAYGSIGAAIAGQSLSTYAAGVE